MRLGNRKQIKIVIYVLIAVITLGIGYATIANIVLSINGTASGSVDSNNFNVHFDRSVTPTMTANKGSAVIDNNDDCKRLMSLWWEELSKGSHRDQLSFN